MIDKLSKCWCGSESYKPFGIKYGICEICGTLRYQTPVRQEELVVKNDEVDLYGQKYWTNDSGVDNFDIHDRSRKDLTERNLHWLNTLLKYRRPPASVLEVGCGHGSFVGLLNLAGYKACGVEMSPWVVDFAKDKFDIPVSLGPLESTSFEDESFDVIVLMDVFEHLPDPTKTIQKCLSLLKHNGLLIMQTPQYKEGISYESLEADGNRFLEMLIPKEHIYLFSHRSVKYFFSQVGVNYIYFEKAIFCC
jgi:2-polyprenyl-3-methyl-5-hydroxy-6-metoxy-1,4-benzoquinol methylase